MVNPKLLIVVLFCAVLIAPGLAAPTISGGMPINASGVAAGSVPIVNGSYLTATDLNLLLEPYYRNDTTKAITGLSIYRDVNDETLSLYGGDTGAPQGGHIQLYGGDNLGLDGGMAFRIGDAAGVGLSVMWISGRTDTPYLHMNSHQIKNVLDPTNAQDAVTKNYLGVLLGNGTAINTSYLPRSGALPMTGNLSMGGYNISNLMDPVAEQDAVTLEYLSELVAGTVSVNGTSVTFQARASSSALYKGQAVYISGATGIMPRVDKADNTDTAKCRVVGLVASDLAANSLGFVRRSGTVVDVDTRATNLNINPNAETWVAGDLLFATTGGGLTKNRPTSGRSVKAAYTLRGSHISDTLLAYPFENPVWSTAASGENVTLRLGDDSGWNKVSIRDYQNRLVANISSLGNPVFNWTGYGAVNESYFYLPGRSGGQAASGGLLAGENLTLNGTMAASGSPILLNPFNTGKVGIHTASRNPTADLEIVGPLPTTILNSTFNMDISAGRIDFTKSRGSGLSNQPGDYLGSITSRTDSGNNYNGAASIYFIDSGGGKGGNIEFLTSPNASSSSSERMRIMNVGNVTIGDILSPTAMLQTQLGYAVRFENYTNGYAYFDSGGNITNVSASAVAINESYAYLPGRSGGQIFSGGSTSGNLTIYGNAYPTTGWVFILPQGGGNVGIGTNITSQRLTVNGAVGATSYTAYSGSGNDAIYRGLGSGGDMLLNYEDGRNIRIFNGSTTQYAVFRSNNFSFGLGVSNPLSQFHSNGGMKLEGLAGGTLTTDALGNVYVVSDEKVKTDIKQFNSGLSNITNINPIKYHFTENSGLDTEIEYTGLSADNLLSALPEAVTIVPDYTYSTVSTKNEKTGEIETIDIKTPVIGDDGKQSYTLAVNDRAILATLVNSVKELSAKNDAQDLVIKNLTARIEKLEKKAGI